MNFMNEKAGFRAIALGLQTKEQVLIFSLLVAVAVVGSTIALFHYKGIRCGMAWMLACVGSLYLIVAVALWHGGSGVSGWDIAVIAALLGAAAALLWNHKKLHRA